ncbi:unnamed protein product [Hyaloperonospora brassicae]|uniref:E2F-associated phosphoprotein n=1 Tax=Hyaloperonospora brassicae TaxID=162125 RepID=A0AAV0TL84_HYABA|nr:unnamed protein product [Hyaloperonospora brassicae]
MSTDDVAFSAYTSSTDDYLAFLPSDESTSDVDEVPSPSASLDDSVEELSSTFASSSSMASRWTVFTPISGSLHGTTYADKRPRATRNQSTVTGSSAVRAIKNRPEREPNVSARVLALYTTRKTQLQDALDAASGGYSSGEAVFRFAKQHDKKSVVGHEDKEDEEDDVLKASPAPVVDKVESRAPEKKNLGRRRPVGGRNERRNEDDESDEHEDERYGMEPDPLYDEQLDDADKLWVQTHFNGARSTQPETDATLCCPCCFLTVCMVCERHVTYTNQYRATAAINCRVKRDDILTYASSGSSAPASMPFHMRKSANTSDGDTAAISTPGREIARLLQADEFFSVVCSDCGTMVGVFDQDQQYHFFNALPSIS